MAVTATILGASGFAGGELLRLIETHPGLDVVSVAGSSQAGKRLTDLYPGFSSYDALHLVGVEEALNEPADIVFSSLPHSESMRYLPKVQGPRIVDLAGDFRLKDPRSYEQWYGQPHLQPDALTGWVYGLTEFHRDAISSAERVANPGCYPAASILALGPLVANGLIMPTLIHIDAKSGVSGAGRGSGEGMDFSATNESVRPYGVTGHKHIPEIEQELSTLAGSAVTVTFVPHLVPMTRGVLVSCRAYANGTPSADRLYEALEEHYRAEPFVKIIYPPLLPDTKRLTGTNFAEVAVRADERTGSVLAFAAIDNLGKGAAGQALQNANLMLGFEETTGLNQRALSP